MGKNKKPPQKVPATLVGDIITPSEPLDINPGKSYSFLFENGILTVTEHSLS